MNLQFNLSALLCVVLALGLIATAATPAIAQHGDLLFSINASDSSKIDVGLVDVGVTILELSGHKAHEVEVAYLGAAIPAEADLEPGVNTLRAGLPGGLNISPNSALPGNTDLNFKFLSFFNPDVLGGTNGNLFYWDYLANPAGPVWEPTPAGHSLTWAHDLASLPLAGSASVDGGNSDVNGFTIAETNALGEIHQHLDTLVSGPLNTGPQLGIYLAAIQVDLTGASSDPFFLVAGVFDPDFSDLQLEAFEAAVESTEEWVEENYDTLVNGLSANGTPEPSTFVLVSIGIASLACSARRHRRRRDEIR